MNIAAPLTLAQTTSTASHADGRRDVIAYKDVESAPEIGDRCAADRRYDVVVVGGGPAGATAATELARAGRSVCLLDRAGRIKPCGGAIPPQLIREFAIPESLLVARIKGARIVAPSLRAVDMPIDGGFVGMVDRESFDEWLRLRATSSGADRCTGTFEQLTRPSPGEVLVHVRRPDGSAGTLRTRVVIGADGARSALAHAEIDGAQDMRYVFAYHEIIGSPQAGGADFDPQRCDVVYEGRLSPDFYAWVFPHGATTSVGVGTAMPGFSMRSAVSALRERTGMAASPTIRREGAPIPMRPMRRWDNGRDVVVVGDAAGLVAPASGEGIYYAMASARSAAQAVDRYLASADPRDLACARRAFMRAHGRVFWILGQMQRFWYANDRRRERFVRICEDRDVQRLTWEAYMNKRLVRARPLVHARIFFKDLAHLLGLVRV